MLSVTSKQEEQLLKQLRDKNVSREVLTLILNGYFTTLLESGKQSMLPELTDFRQDVRLSFPINIAQNLDAEINAGHYDLGGHGIQAHFAEQFSKSDTEDSYQATVDILYPNKEVTTDEMIKRLSGKYRKPTILEFVALGAQYPELQLLFPIVGIIPNPVYDHDFGMGYPVLDSTTKEEYTSRELTLVYGIWKWYDNCRFAAVQL